MFPGIKPIPKVNYYTQPRPNPRMRLCQRCHDKKPVWIVKFEYGGITYVRKSCDECTKEWEECLLQTKILKKRKIWFNNLCIWNRL